jgi:DNA gyrase/topoisomerase IV subunit B
MARPMPRVPPVTIAAWSLSDVIFEFYGGLAGTGPSPVRMTTGMASSAPFTTLRRLFEDRFQQLSTDAENLFAEARERVRRDYADQINQAVRRMRLAPDAEELNATLVDTAACFASSAAVFTVEGDIAAGERIRGVNEEAAEKFASLRLPLASAPALAGAVESREPAVAAAIPGEVSQEMVDLAGHGAEGRVSVFPVISREKTVALLYAWGNPQGPALETLAQVASAIRTAMDPAPAPPPEPLLQIEPAPKAKPSWDSLSPEEQQLHLRAQRSARVQVAELRLYESEAVKSGRASRDLYGALRQKIDDARGEFHRTFFTKCPSMVDYLHLELVRTLANDDPELLGKEYPGPLV